MSAGRMPVRQQKCILEVSVCYLSHFLHIPGENDFFFKLRIHVQKDKSVNSTH